MSYQDVFVEFWEQVLESAKEGQFAKLTMAKTIGKPNLRNIFMRPVESDGEFKVLLKLRYRSKETEDQEDELTLDEALEVVKRLLEDTDDEFELKSYDRLGELRISDESLKGDYTLVRPGDCIVAFSRADIFSIKRQVEALTKYTSSQSKMFLNLNFPCSSLYVLPISLLSLSNSFTFEPAMIAFVFSSFTTPAISCSHVH